MATTGSCVSTMEEHYFRITASPRFATSLYTRNTRKGHIGRLASLASYHSEHSGLIKLSLSNIITALGQSNRVRQVALYLAGWQLEEVFAAMQVPFPELIHLQLRSYDKTLPVIPDSFLGESAPRL